MRLFTLLLVMLLAITAIMSPAIAAQQSIPESGPVKLAALGDSLTEGDGDEGNGGYPARLEKLLQDVRAKLKVTNLGKSGWDSNALINGDQGLPSQLKQAVAQKPDIALVWIGSNDLWYSTYGTDDQAPIDNFETNIDTILSALQASDITTFIALLDDQAKRPFALKSDSGYTRADLKRMSKFAEQFNEIITDKAQEYGAITVDFFNTAIFTDEKTLYDDGNHPNAAGYDEIAKTWFNTLEPYLAGLATLPAPIPVESTAAATESAK
jgi:acyl-CoA thioesterase I